tara:strand:+ start:3020 stop:3880 length:861 start_codon:yes stop_codon:yes gene_type:complete
MIQDNFCAFILTHGRPDRVYTYNLLHKTGYTGRIVIVIDNEDPKQQEYRDRFGDQVYVFDKQAVANSIDEGDNFNDRRAIIYARNACWDIARELGIEYFIQLDDDYTEFRHRKNHRGEYITGSVKEIEDFDSVITALLRYYKSIPALAIAMAQGGDYIGGVDGGSYEKPKRKCMNSFVCSVNRPFRFFGRINEDVNTYTNLGSRGGLFLTIMSISLQQKQTQSNSGGMTDLYLDSGTYVKSFYSVMYQPSSVRVSILNTLHPRIHHRVSWRYTVPCILGPEHKQTI